MIIKFTNIKVLSATALVTLGITIIVLKRKRNKISLTKNKVVIIHYKDAYSNCPSRSIELIQLETWLRISSIKYDLNLVPSRFYSYQNRPKLALHGIIISDIDEAISYLERVNGKDLSDCLNRIEKSIARSFLVLFKNSLEKSILIFRFLFSTKDDIEVTWAEFMFNKLILKKEIKSNYFSKFSKDKVLETLESDLMAIQDFLKSKKFLFGETPSTNDAALFGILSQIFCSTNLIFDIPINKKFPYLFNYFENIKKIYWKDWEERSC